MKIKQYKGLKAVKYTHKVTEEEIDARIQQDVEKATTMADVEDRAVENGDIVNLDYAGSVDGVAFEGGTAQGQTLEIGSGRFISGFEEQMIGMQLGEEKDLTVKFPEQYHAENLAGKDAVFKVKAHKIVRSQMPELTEEFAAAQGFENDLLFGAGIHALMLLHHQPLIPHQHGAGPPQHQFLRNICLFEPIQHAAPSCCFLG